MNPFQRIFFLPFLLVLAVTLSVPAQSMAQKKEKGKGDLEDFADDYGEDESGSDDDSEATEFFLWLFFENIGDLAQLWGGTAGTEFGPFPSFPYAEGDGFMTTTSEFRSYYFNTEVNYHPVNADLRSYILKWETQFVGKSKLSFDLAVYEENLVDEVGPYKDHLTFFGFRYGYALYRTPQMILNLEGGFRGFHRNTSHGGPEIAVDFTLFPKRPLIIETELAAAYVSNGPLYTVETSAGIALGRFEILGGLRILKNKDSDLLDGFRIGLRVWY
ncbi:MAG: hypothetical protein ACE5IY_14695 [bacterium]